MQARVIFSTGLNTYNTQEWTKLCWQQKTEWPPY